MFYFVPNLKSYTWHTGRGIKRSSIYLLSADYAQGANMRLAKEVVQGKRLLCADNGFFDLVRVGKRKFANQGAELNRYYARLRADLNRYPRPGDIPREHIVATRRLLAMVEAWCDATITNEVQARTLEIQFSMQPSYIIGPENPTLAIMASLGLSRDEIALAISDYTRIYQRTLRHARQLIDTGISVYAPVHPMDFESARAMGALAAQHGVKTLSCGLGGLLTSRTYTDYTERHNTIRDWGGAAPIAYLRSVEVLAGLHQGYFESAGHTPCVHVLGLGTPVLLPLLARLGFSADFCVADSTSPIVDAWSSPTISLYVLDPAPLKLKAHKIITHWLADDQGWTCKCPYCRKMRRDFPPDIASARTLWQSMGRPTDKDILLDDAFGDFLPLLARASAPHVRRAGALARVGHNHWMLGRLERHSQKNGESGYLTLMDSYAKYPFGSAAWKRAVAAATEIVSDTVAITT